MGFNVLRKVFASTAILSGPAFCDFWVMHKKIGSLRGTFEWHYGVRLKLITGACTGYWAEPPTVMRAQIGGIRRIVNLHYRLGGRCPRFRRSCQKGGDFRTLPSMHLIDALVV